MLIKQSKIIREKGGILADKTWMDSLYQHRVDVETGSLLKNEHVL